MSHERALARNTAWLMLATLGQKVISFLVFYLIARRVGPLVTGKYFFAVSITSIFVVLADFGLTPVVIREMASNMEEGRAALARALKLKWFLLPVAVVFSLGYALAVNVEPEVFVAVLVACLVMMADSISLLWYGALRGKKDLRFEAFGMLVCQLIAGIVGVLATFFARTVASLVFALLCGSVWNVIWSYVWSRRLGMRVIGVAPWPIRKMMTAAIPFGLAGLFVKVYSYLDSLLIREFHGHEAVGQYAVAYKLTYALQFLPLTFVAALYPAMSSAHARGDKKALDRALSGSLRLMMLTSVPLSAILSSLAQPLVHTLYGKAYAGAIAPLTILPWVLVPIFLDFPVGSLLNASRRTVLKTTAMGCTMVINAIGNILFVPQLGPAGAAWAGLVSFTILLLLGLWFIRHELPSMGWCLALAARGMVVGIFTWLSGVWLRDHAPLIMSLLFTGAVALVLLFATRLLQISDVMQIISWLRRRPVEPPSEIEEETETHV